MPTSVVALQIFLVLLPGFAGTYIVQLLAVRAKQTDLDKIIEALLFSFLIYVSYSVFSQHSPVRFVHTPQADSIEFHPGNLLGLTGLTFLYALAMILFVNKDGALLLRKMKLTERTSRNSIWNDAFQDVDDPKNGTTVQVELADGRSVQGFVGFYSDTAEESSIFLRNARWIGDEGQLVDVPGPGILLTKNANIVSVSFLNPATAENSSP